MATLRIIEGIEIQYSSYGVARAIHYYVDGRFFRSDNVLSELFFSSRTREVF